VSAYRKAVLIAVLVVLIACDQ